MRVWCENNQNQIIMLSVDHKIRFFFPISTNVDTYRQSFIVYPLVVNMWISFLFFRMSNSTPTLHIHFVARNRFPIVDWLIERNYILFNLTVAFDSIRWSIETAREWLLLCWVYVAADTRHHPTALMESGLACVRCNWDLGKRVIDRCLLIHHKLNRNEFLCLPNLRSIAVLFILSSSCRRHSINSRRKQQSRRPYRVHVQCTQRTHDKRILSVECTASTDTGLMCFLFL